MKNKEKPITSDRSRWRERLRSAMARAQTDNPYESERHQAAKDYISERKIEVWPLRGVAREDEKT